MSIGYAIGIIICGFIGLTVLGGIVARPHKLKYLLVAFAGWLVPGLGLWLIGKKQKAVICGLLVCVTFGLGCYLSDFRDVRFGDNPFYYVGRFGSGLIFGLTETVLSYYPRGMVSLKFSEIGFLYICTAGVLNLIILSSVFNPVLTPVQATVEPDGLPKNSPETQSGPAIRQGETMPVNSAGGERQ